MTTFQLHGGASFGIENVLRQNILSSDYYNKTCLQFETYVPGCWCRCCPALSCTCS